MMQMLDYGQMENVQKPDHLLNVSIFKYNHQIIAPTLIIKI